MNLNERVKDHPTALYVRGSQMYRCQYWTNMLPFTGFIQHPSSGENTSKASRGNQGIFSILLSYRALSLIISGTGQQPFSSFVFLFLLNRGLRLPHSVMIIDGGEEAPPPLIGLQTLN